jgi:hypothetical protein
MCGAASGACEYGVAGQTRFSSEYNGHIPEPLKRRCGRVRLISVLSDLRRYTGAGHLLVGAS